MDHEPEIQTLMSDPASLLRQWIKRQIDDTQAEWLSEQDTRLTRANNDQALFLAISFVPRKLGKADLDLSADDLAAADAARSGWDPRGWSVDQAGRLYFLLSHGGEGEAFAARLSKLMATADVAEEITFLRGLPLYPDQSAHEPLARKGCRTNMQPVFEAIAHRNPYPAEQFDTNAWNHLILKALFVGSTLHPIQRFEKRANADLARIMSDYAHERWAAKRPVTPEIWRGVGPFATGALLDDLVRVIASDQQIERYAGALALAASPDPKARDILETSCVELPGGVTWNNILAGSEAV